MEPQSPDSQRMITPQQMPTVEAVGRHYDDLDVYYRDIWGEHVHHGLWETGRESPEAACERLIRVDYERLVAEPGTVAPWLADRCGLPWRDSALDIAQNSAASLTASAAQVRGGIYTSSSGIWRNYGTHLAPLREKLIANGIALT